MSLLKCNVANSTHLLLTPSLPPPLLRPPLHFREELLQSLAIVQHCLLGAGCMLPPLDGPHVTDL